MKATELRIGNWLKTCTPNMDIMIPHVTAQVQAISLFHELSFCKTPFDNGITMPVRHTMPIELNREWLIKLGFNDRSGSLANGLGFGIAINSFLELAWYVSRKEEQGIRLQTIGSGFTFNTKVIYVHQLQNLYFALTGKELQFKASSSNASGSEDSSEQGSDIRPDQNNKKP